MTSLFPCLALSPQCLPNPESPCFLIVYLPGQTESPGGQALHGVCSQLRPCVWHKRETCLPAWCPLSPHCTSLLFWDSLLSHMT